jgi:hypothetical protein
MGSLKCAFPVLGVDTEDSGRPGELGKGEVTSIQAWGENGERFYARRDMEERTDIGVLKLRREFYGWLRELPRRDLWACNAAYDAANLGLISFGVSAAHASGGYTSWRHPLLAEHVLFDTHTVAPLSVAAMGEQIGVEKLPFAPDDREYGMRDAEIVCRWVCRLRQGLAALADGVQIHATTGSTAAALWRAMGGAISKLPKPLHHAARSAYRGGRVEVLRFKATGPAEVWDMRSAFPWAMMQGRFPAGTWEPTREMEPEGLYDVTVRASGRLGPLPVRCEGTNCYPVGRFRGVWFGEELMVPGVKVEELHAGWRASEFVDPFREYVSTLWAARNAEEGTPTQAAAKLLLNALYGIVGHNGTVAGLASVGAECQLEGRYVAPGVIAWKIDKGQSLGSNPVWAGLITARVRARLYRAALGVLDRLVYMDTDSLFLRGQLGVDCAPVPQGNELGAWRLQSILDDLEVTAPKVYAMKFLTSWRYRAKGVSLKAAEDFVRNSRTRWRAPLSIIQAAITGGRPGEWVQVERAIRAQYRARCVEDDGSTSPWEFEQLAAATGPEPWDADPATGRWKDERRGAPSAWGKRRAAGR